MEYPQQQPHSPSHSCGTIVIVQRETFFYVNGLLLMVREYEDTNNVVSRIFCHATPPTSFYSSEHNKAIQKFYKEYFCESQWNLKNELHDKIKRVAKKFSCNFIFEKVSEVKWDGEK